MYDYFVIQPKPLSYFFYIRYQTNFVSPKLEATEN